MRTWLLLGCLLAAASGAQADDEMSCGAETVRTRLQALALDRLCLDDSLQLKDLAWSLAVAQGGLTVTDIITTKISDVPLARECEAQLAYEFTLNGEALGPGPGIPLRLAVAGDARTLLYTVGRFDDGRLYVRPAAGCWRIDRLTPAP